MSVKLGYTNNLKRNNKLYECYLLNGVNILLFIPIHIKASFNQNPCCLMAGLYCVSVPCTFTWCMTVPKAVNLPCLLAIRNRCLVVESVPHSIVVFIPHSALYDKKYAYLRKSFAKIQKSLWYARTSLRYCRSMSIPTVQLWGYQETHV
ncbi:hypothetical protein F4703DRAFT_1797178 [Phycomyces blakesleeanus]